MENSGVRADIGVASDEEYGKALEDKLREEAEEFIESENPEELADILEVVVAICESRGIPFREMKESEKIRPTGRADSARGLCSRFRIFY